MSEPEVQPLILFVSAEVKFVPHSLVQMRPHMVANSEEPANHLVDVITGLYDLGVDVHVAQPDYRKVFKTYRRENQEPKSKKIPAKRVHLTEDRAFYYSGYPDANFQRENIKISLAFQREVVHQIIPRVQPDLIHCHDWMTGLIPAMAKELDIPCLFTVHHSHSAKSCLSHIEDMGIDAAAFWQYLFYDNFPSNYEQTRDTNPTDFLLSGIFAASMVSIAPTARLLDIVEEQKGFFEASLRRLLAQKWKAGYASTFNRQTTAQNYIDTYERMLQRPVIDIIIEESKSHSMDARLAV